MVRKPIHPDQRDRFDKAIRDEIAYAIERENSIKADERRERAARLGLSWLLDRALP